MPAVCHSDKQREFSFVVVLEEAVPLSFVRIGDHAVERHILHGFENVALDERVRLLQLPDQHFRLEAFGSRVAGSESIFRVFRKAACAAEKMKIVV